MPVLVAVVHVVVPEPVQVVLELVLELRLHPEQLDVGGERRGLQLLPRVAEVVNLLQVFLADRQLVAGYDVESFLKIFINLGWIRKT